MLDGSTHATPPIFEWLTWDERAKNITAIHAESTPLVAAQVGKVHRVEDLAIPTIRKDITWRAHCMIHDLDWQHMATHVQFRAFCWNKTWTKLG